MMKTMTLMGTFAMAVGAGFSHGEDRVDGWYEVDCITAASRAGEALVQGGNNKAFHYDTADRKAGDFSILYQHRLSPRSSKIGFTPYPFPVWDLSMGTSVHLWLKIEGNDWDKDVRFRLAIRDQNNNGAYYNLKQEDFRSGGWVELGIPFREMEGIGSVNLRELAELYLDTRLHPDAVVRFDDVYFHIPERLGGALGVTDKSVRQRMLEARLSRNMRAYTAYQQMAEEQNPPVLSDLWAQLWIGRDLGHVNARLVQLLTRERSMLDEQYGFADTWHLFATPWLIRTYRTFGPGERPTSGRLSEEAAAALLAVLWERTLEKNDIHWARARSPWHMDGSENHDLNMVVANYLSSGIFMKLPQYADRVYPDKGAGGGSAYWFHVEKGDIRFHGPYGGADLSDGKKYVAKDHYDAWGAHLKEIIRERARKGFFLEQASPGYMKYTLAFIQDVHEFTDDPEMQELTRSFLDLVWSTWAMESLHGQRGGAKTRDHLTLNVRGDSMYNMAKFLFGGMLPGSQHYYQLPAMDYQLPEIAWQLALDRQGLGEFAAVSRAIGEEPSELPRKPGLERTLDLGAEHRMFRYAWVTPEYILGAQMDHPLAVHSHLSPTSRLFGLNFSSHPDARIFPYGVRRTDNGDWELVRRAGIMSRTVQHENVLISQQSRGYTQVNPEWYPQRSLRAEEYAVYISPLADRIEERDGWIFIEQGDAFAAIRIVAGEYSASDRPEESASFVTYVAKESLLEPLATDSYEWNANRTLLVSKDPFNPIIWDCSSRRHFPSLEAFMQAVLGNRLELIKTVVPGWYRLVYKGTGENAATLHLNLANKEIPTVNGTALDYTPERVLHSPFIESDYDSGVIRLRKGSLGRVLDFTEVE
jgi:hypothetical protein